MNLWAQFKAKQTVSKDESMYEHRWTELVESDNRDKLNELTTTLCTELEKNQRVRLNCSTKKSAGSVEVLQDCKDIDVLYARAEFINDAFQSLVSILLETGLSAKPAAEAKAVAEGKPAAEGTAAADSRVDNLGSSITSLLKKDLKTLFSEEDAEEILRNLEPCYQKILKQLWPPTGVKSTNQLTESASAATQSQAPQSPSQVDEPNKTAPHTAVTVKSDTVGHDAQHETDPTVSVRRGPVKLPARAIAKVSTAPLQLPPSSRSRC